MRWVWINTSASIATISGLEPRQLVEPRSELHLVGIVLLKAFVPQGPLVFGIDETLERRWAKKIAAKGVYRDPVRSSHGHFAKSSGLRWVCMMVLVPIPWASRVWALPFLSVLAPSERHAARQGKRHKKITEWAWQLLLQVRRFGIQSVRSSR